MGKFIIELCQELFEALVEQGDDDVALVVGQLSVANELWGAVWALLALHVIQEICLKSKHLRVSHCDDLDGDELLRGSIERLVDDAKASTVDLLDYFKATFNQRSGDVVSSGWAFFKKLFLFFSMHLY